jgi:signal transduction histidine kinase
MLKHVRRISLRQKFYLLALPASLLAVLMVIAAVFPFLLTRNKIAEARSDVAISLNGERLFRSGQSAMWHVDAALFLGVDDGALHDARRRVADALDAIVAYDRSSRTLESLGQIRRGLLQTYEGSDRALALARRGKRAAATDIFETRVVPLYKRAVEEPLLQLIDRGRAPVRSAFVELAGKASATSGFAGGRLTAEVVRASSELDAATFGGSYQLNTLLRGRNVLEFLRRVDLETSSIDGFRRNAASDLANWSRIVRSSPTVDADELQTMDSLEASAHQIASWSEDLVGLTRAGDTKSALELFRSHYEPALDTQLAFAERLTAQEEREVYEHMSLVAREAFRIQIVVFGLAFALLMAAAASVISARRLSRRVGSITKVATKIGGGDLDARVPVDTPDELGDLAEAFNSMTANLSSARERATGILERTVESGEQERSRLAAELHDGPVQRMTGVLYGLERAGLRLERGEIGDVSGLIDDLKAKVSEEVRALRNLMSELRPPVLDERGLGAALADYVNGFESREGLGCTLDVDIAHRLSPSLETTMYRVVQESLANVSKHAHAANVDVKTWAANGTVHLDITDDGIGFDLATLTGHGTDHFGLTAMEERARMAGGSFRCVSSRGHGTKVMATFPQEVCT